MAQSGEEVIPPNNTVYARNLNEKIPVDELKKSLFHVFSQYGKVLEIMANKTLKMRGQAFIVFEDVASSTRALREMQGFDFYKKPMKVAFAKAKSDIVAQADGSFVARPKRKTESSKDEPKPKKKTGPTLPQNHGFSAPRPSLLDDEVPPSESLLLQNLPTETTAEMLQHLFGKFPGYLRSRFIAAKPGIAFLDFSAEFEASSAMEAMQGFRIDPQHAMHIGYARK